MKPSVFTDDPKDIEKLLFIYQEDHVWIKVITTTFIESQLAEHLKFRPDGYRFDPKYINKLWDGWVRLFDRKNEGRVYAGLLPEIVRFAEIQGYQITLQTKPTFNNLTDDDVENHFKWLRVPFDRHDYQVEAVREGLNRKRALLISATGSGKSLMIYGIVHKLRQNLKGKILILAPRVQLVHQMYTDFETYSRFNTKLHPKNYCHKIHQGQEKDSKLQVYISTWQSLQDIPTDYFSKFDAVIADEVHRCESDEVRRILEACVKAEYRIGLTGSLADCKVHELTLQGLFGKQKLITKAKDLMDRNILSKLKIICTKLVYDDATKESMVGKTYHEEKAFIVGLEKRNNFIARIAEKEASTGKNVFVMFTLVEKHGKLLYETIKKLNPDRKVVIIHGKTETDVREKIRKEIEGERGTIGVVSTGTFSEGINIRNLECLIFAAPSKAKIQIIQSIGRSLRIGDHSDQAIVYDIVDDLSIDDSVCYSMRHFGYRTTLYEREQYPYTVATIKFNSQGRDKP